MVRKKEPEISHFDILAASDEALKNIVHYAKQNESIDERYLIPLVVVDLLIYVFSEFHTTELKRRFIRDLKGIISRMADSINSDQTINTTLSNYH